MLISIYRRFLFVIITLTLFLTANTTAQLIIFNSFPDWQSQDVNSVSTGLGFGDINLDGWDDMIVANGNDILRQHLVVYYNQGDGTFPTMPSWSSGDIDYHGHLAVGDVNGDGYPDVAVSSFLGIAGFSEPGYVKVYFNEGGQLESQPSYRTSDVMYTFSCALGDADGDGDLDLAVACGEPYSGVTDLGRIYLNNAGQLDSLPGWSSSVQMGALDVDFADMDRNGYLDLIFACHLTPNYIFLADSNGQIPTQPAWQSQDNSYYANSLTIAKVDSNEYPDLMISDNNQLGPSGKFKAYLFDNPPTGQSSPAWYSATDGYGSAILAEDITNDGYTDLLAGRWWGNVRLYAGIANGFTTSPSWTSGSTSVIEAYSLRDVDQDNHISQVDTLHILQDSIHVVYLKRADIERITMVSINGLILAPGSDYCTVSGGNWISVKSALKNGDQIVIEYVYSNDRDLAVTNWDNFIGNYLFYNQSAISMVTQASIPESFSTVDIYPNPFNQRCTINIRINVDSKVSMEVFDLNGQSVKDIFNGNLTIGEHLFYWDGKGTDGREVASGVYLYRMQTGYNTISKKLLMIR